jgi:uncharacterized membrane protein
MEFFMQILLINVNPVVSRLFMLCSREENIAIDEVSRVAAVKNKPYDMIFVDESVYEQNTLALLSQFEAVKKVFISYDCERISGFDMTIEKPFLPSLIIELFESHALQEKTIAMEKEIALKEVLIIEEEEEEISRVPSIFPLTSEEADEPNILDISEIEKIKNLLDMDTADEIEDILSEAEIERRKVSLIKQQLMNEGLEIVEENEIVNELNLNITKDIKRPKKTKKQKNKKLKFTKKNMERIEDAVEIAMANMTKKQMKKLLKGKEIEIKIMLKGKN